MKRKKIVVGNWKMNPESLRLAEKLFKNIAISKKRTIKPELVITPPATYIRPLSKISKKIKLGAQNIHSEEYGAHTGEVSGAMVYDAGARYVILGHSERRAMGEDGEFINKKVKTALKEGLIPIVCVGEKSRDRDFSHFRFIQDQLEECFAGIPKNSVGKAIVAYEPVWAIGKDAVREATPEEFREMAILIRKFFNDNFSAKIALSLSVLYGGSVNTKNAEAFVEKGEADGFLVGRASLSPDKFLKIAESVN